MEPEDYHRQVLQRRPPLSPRAGERDRLPQWSHGETKELLGLRSELDQSFMEAKRNKMLWELVSAKMRDRGFRRTPDQCKCKWKNLVARYKGSEAMEAETSRQFPFQDDMRRIFSDRMERLLNIDDGTMATQQLRVWSEEEDDDDDTLNVDNRRRRMTKIDDNTKKKKKKKKEGEEEEEEEEEVTAAATSSGGGRDRYRREVLVVMNAVREFMRWQMQAEAKWLQALEKRELERRAMEMEWRRAMEAIEAERAERAEMERRWREKEEERRDRAEERAERRHQLMVELLTKLSNDGL